MTHWVAVPIGAIVTAVTIVMRHSYSSGVSLAVMTGRIKTIAMVLQLATVLLVVSGDVVCSSAGLNFIVQLKNEKKRRKTSTTSILFPVYWVYSSQMNKRLH